MVLITLFYKINELRKQKQKKRLNSKLIDELTSKSKLKTLESS